MSDQNFNPGDTVWWPALFVDGYELKKGTVCHYDEFGFGNIVDRNGYRESPPRIYHTEEAAEHAAVEATLNAVKTELEYVNNTLTEQHKRQKELLKLHKKLERKLNRER